MGPRSCFWFDFVGFRGSGLGFIIVVVVAAAAGAAVFCFCCLSGCCMTSTICCDFSVDGGAQAGPMTPI